MTPNTELPSMLRDTDGSDDEGYQDPQPGSRKRSSRGTAISDFTRGSNFNKLLAQQLAINAGKQRANASDLTGKLYHARVVSLVAQVITWYTHDG